MQSPIIKIDTLKPIGTLVDLTGQFNARVGDAFTPITIQWTEGGNAKNLDGLHPVFEAVVGQGHVENNEVLMNDDAVPVRWVGDQSSIRGYGQTILKLPPQVFSKSGLCYGYLALENDQGVRETSVDIWFKVLGGVYNMGLACNYFITDFQKALAKAKGDVFHALDEIKKNYELKIQSAENAIDDAENAIDDNVAALKNLKDSVGAIQAQIDAGNVVTLTKHNTDIDRISKAIEDKLAQMDIQPEAFENEAALKAKYPNGKPGIMVTADTGHKYIWANSTWTDAGIYQSVGIADGSISIAKFDDSIKRNLFECDTLDITPQQGFYSTFNKTFNSSADYLSVTSACKPGELFSCSTKIKDSTVAVVMFFKDESCTQYHSDLLSGVVGTYNDYVFSIPEGVAGFAITSTVDFSPVIKKYNPVAIKDFVQKTENQLSYRPPLSGELLNGFYSTINDIFNANDGYKALKANVTAGDKIYFNAVCSTNTVATCVFWDASGKKLSTLKGGEIGTWSNVEAIAPTNTAFVTITSTADNPPSATIQQPFNGQIVMDALPNVKPLMFNRKLDDRLEILSKYNTTQDLKLTFGKVSANNTWQFSGASLLDNTGKFVNSDFNRTGKDYIAAYTDYVSPIYNLRAINNINGDQPDSWHYTGGWHGYDNANSGTATARTIGCKVFVDGFELGDEIVNGYETKLIVTNLIQGTNTKKADGSGREILQEKITYTIACGTINIEAEYTALEDLTLNGYSFLQFQLVDRFKSKFIAYDDDSHRSWISDLSSDINGGDKTTSSTNCMQFIGENDKCTMFYDPNFGIGRLQYNNSFRWHYRTYQKAYFDLINVSPGNSPVTFKSGEVFVCRGGYKFEAL